MNQRTQWLVQSPSAYDALCLLNIWTGDPFYTSQHPKLLERWQPRFTPEIREAFSRIEQSIRGDGGIISADLCRSFSSVQPNNLHDLEQAILAPENLLSLYNQLNNNDLNATNAFGQLLPDLLKLVHFLQASPFETERLQDLGENHLQFCQELHSTLESFDIVQAVELALGQSLEAPQIEVFLLAYTAPHGIKLIGNRFITSPQWSAQITARVAIHELMHPPFDTAHDKLQKAFEMLVQDSKLKQVFEDHDPQFGYNTWEGYVEENCVRALDQVICEQFKIARDANERWQKEDEGMHLLAARLTPLLRERKPTGVNPKSETTQATF